MARKLAAWKLNCSFKRSAGFCVPSHITIAAKRVPLSVPNDNGTKVAFIDILLDDCYRLGTFPRSTAVIVDIGAHVGLFSIAARRHFPSGVIHAYEPNPAIWTYLEANVQAMDVIIHREAVNHTAGSGVLASHLDSVQTRVELKEGGSIPYIDFESVVKRAGGRIDVLKLDCEGGEWQILSVSEPWQRVRHLTMEYHLWAGYSLADIMERLSTLGFRVTSQVASGLDFGLITADRWVKNVQAVSGEL